MDVASITVIKESDKVIITGVGELDLRNSPEFSRALKSAVDSGLEVVVDFRRATFIDTAIIADLVPPGRAMLERNTRLKILVTADSHPEYVLATVRFDEFMDITSFEAEKAK
jgi:anti-anti-sigma regulatory factor